MSKKVLSIVSSAYRATVEEQDDTILWLNSMFKGADLDVSVLLRANCVNYAVRGQDASGLSIGNVPVGNPPKIDEDVSDLIAKGVPVYYLTDDADARGISADRLIDGVKGISMDEIPAMMDGFDQVWHW